jgi:hypothetical protein
MLKRLLLSLLAVACAAGIARGVVLTGTNSSDANTVVQVGYVQLSTTDAITAAAGGGQTNAVLLNSAYNRVTVVATANDSVKLPPCQSGAAGAAGLANSIGVFMWVTNADASDSMNVFPSTGGQINAVGTNNAYAVAAGKTTAFLCSPGGTTWYSVLGG